MIAEIFLIDWVKADPDHLVSKTDRQKCEAYLAECQAIIMQKIARDEIDAVKIDMGTFGTGALLVSGGGVDFGTMKAISLSSIFSTKPDSDAQQS